MGQPFGATRMVVQKVSEQTGWTIVVDNKPCANSILGADLVAKAAPTAQKYVYALSPHVLKMAFAYADPVSLVSQDEGAPAPRQKP